MSVPDEHWLFSTVFDVIPFAIYVTDVETLELVHANKLMRERIKQIGGLEAINGMPCWKVIYGQEERCNFCRIPSLVAGIQDGTSIETTFEHFSDSGDNWLQLHEKIITWYDGRRVKYSIAVEITKLKETQNSLAEAHAQLAIQNRELERISATDQLTSVANRRQIERNLREEVARAERYGTPLSILLFDLDRFKLVNDMHGHNAGDAVLRKIGELLTSITRENDAVGRWGGEEFLVVCSHTTHDEAKTVAEKLRKAFELNPVPEINRPVTASFGIVQWRTGEEPHALLARADEKLYQAKSEGRNKVVA